MVGGNSIVLYSRLHLLTQNPVLLRCVLWGVLINTVLMYIPTTTLSYGTNRHPNNPHYINGYQIMERIQMTLFSVQEFAISGLYLMEASKYLRMVYEKDTRTRRLMYELLAVNVALIVLDIGLLSVEYEDLYEIEVTLKGLVYSIKLKLELGVLSRLVKIVTRGHGLHKTATFATDAAEKGSSIGIERVGTARTASSTPRPHSTQSSAFQRARSKDGSTPSMNFITSATLAGTTSEVNQPILQDSREDESAAHIATTLSVNHEMPQRNKVSRESSITDLYPGRIEG